ncbi:alpha/beta hydrolase, partial [Streptomyces sp. MBT57]|nr:alpha/beta hydrolase [Streptomyces sp. MBT57]
VYAHEALAESHLRFASHSGHRPDVLAAHLDPWRGEEGRAAYYRQYRQLEQAATDEFQHLLGSVPVPTRIIWGREDGFLPPPFAEQLHALIPHSELHWVEGAGHATPEDAPARLLALLTREFRAGA